MKSLCLALALFASFSARAEDAEKTHFWICKLQTEQGEYEAAGTEPTPRKAAYTAYQICLDSEAEEICSVTYLEAKCRDTHAKK